MTAEIRKLYIEAGYKTTINLNDHEALKRVRETEARSKKNPDDIELEWIAMGCASAYSDILARMIPCCEPKEL